MPVVVPLRQHRDDIATPEVRGEVGAERRQVRLRHADLDAIEVADASDAADECQITDRLALRVTEVVRRDQCLVLLVAPITGGVVTEGNDVARADCRAVVRDEDARAATASAALDRLDGGYEV